MEGIHHPIEHLSFLFYLLVLLPFPSNPNFYSSFVPAVIEGVLDGLPMLGQPDVHLSLTGSLPGENSSVSYRNPDEIGQTGVNIGQTGFEISFSRFGPFTTRTCPSAFGV